MEKEKLNRLDLKSMKKKGQAAVWITAYDYWTAQFTEQSGMDMILVGDSLGMCVYGYEGTVPVTMDQCIWHCEAVRRAAPNTFVIGDMPFLSYQVSVEDSVRNAGRFFKENRVDAIKLEGGKDGVPQVKAIADGGMLVMGDIGLTPQSSRRSADLKRGVGRGSGDGTDIRRESFAGSRNILPACRGSSPRGMQDHRDDLACPSIVSEHGSSQMDS